MEDVYPVVPDDFEPVDGAGESPAAGAEAVAASEPPPVISADVAVAWSRRLFLPFRVDGRWLRTISLRHLSQGDIDDFGAGTITRRDLLCRLTGLHPDVIRALKWPDSEKLHLAFQDSLPSFFVTGPEDP